MALFLVCFIVENILQSHLGQDLQSKDIYHHSGRSTLRTPSCSKTYGTYIQVFDSEWEAGRKFVVATPSCMMAGAISPLAIFFSWLMQPPLRDQLSTNSWHRPQYISFLIYSPMAHGYWVFFLAWWTKIFPMCSGSYITNGLPQIYI